MSKRVALKDFVEVDGVDLSNFARSVQYSSEHEQVDVSGFSATGADEFLAGKTTQSVTVEFYGSYGSGEVHQTLFNLHKNRTEFDFAWRPDQTASVSSTNPELRGVVQCLSYGPGATRGDAETFSVTFTAADEDGLWFYST
ncbi:MAG TPA: hypothetical protein VLA89_05255 [Gemmatimonadales bacterium]|nr:hypothetical protein [Gemmatimonadales bacterium]